MGLRILWVINIILGIPLGYLMYFCYTATKNYGVAIILFTLISKIVLFPLSISKVSPMSRHTFKKRSVIFGEAYHVIDAICIHYATVPFMNDDWYTAAGVS